MNNCDAMPEVFCWRSWCHLFTAFSFQTSRVKTYRTKWPSRCYFFNGDSIKAMLTEKDGVWGYTRCLLPFLTLDQRFQNPGEGVTYSSCHWCRSWNKDPSGSIRGNSFLICLPQRRAEEQGPTTLPEPSDPRKLKEERKICPCCLCSAVIVNVLTLHNREEKPNDFQTLTNQTSYPSSQGKGQVKAKRGRSVALRGSYPKFLILIYGGRGK